MSKIKQNKSILHICNPHIIILILVPAPATVTTAQIHITGRKPELPIISVSDHTIRLTLTPIDANNKAKPPIDSPVLVSRNWPCPALKTIELKDVRTVMLKKLRITVRTSPLTIKIDNKEGKAVQQLTFNEKIGSFTFWLAKGPVFGLGVGAQQFDRRGAFYPMKSGMHQWRWKVLRVSEYVCCSVLKMEHLLLRCESLNLTS